MTIDKMLEQRYTILLEALLMGVPLTVSKRWIIFMKGGALYETVARGTHDKTQLSKITLNDFISRYRNISNEDIKTVFGNIRLTRLQKRLIEKNS